MGVTTSLALEASDLFRFFHAADGDETVALRGVSLAVGPGEVIAIVGPSGSGKSTLVSCLAGLDVPDAGFVRIAGDRMSRHSEIDRAALRAHRVGMMFQSGNLIQHLSVAENVAFARKLGGRSADRASVDGLLQRLGILERALEYPSRLSGGETARAGLAVALANEPAIVLADEPTGELDGTNSLAVLDILCECADYGSAVLLVTHNADVARRATRTLELRDGAIA
jgi:putative ABC transport system ATP-binding protein